MMMVVFLDQIKMGLFALTIDSPYALINGQKVKEEVNRTIINVYGEYSITS